MKILLLTLFCFSLLLVVSCSNFHMQAGRAETVSVSDSLLSDSSIFVGYIYDLGYDPPDYPVQDAQVWIENSNMHTTPDTAGYYYIKTVPGTYTIKCERNFNEWPELIEEVKNVKINKNEKVHINFYLGFVDE